MTNDSLCNRLRSLGMSPAWLWLSLLVVAAAAFLLTIGPLLRIPYRFAIDYNEGWNAYHAQRAMTGAALYDAANTWTPLEYPPLSFYVVGYLGKLLGDPVLAGRSLSFLALLLVSAGVAKAVVLLGGRPWEATLAGLLCLGLFAAHATHIVGMNDPQMLGHLFVTAGLLMYLAGPPSPKRLFAVALLLSLGLFVKYNLVAVPAAIGLDLLLRQRRLFVLWTGFMVLLVGGGLALCVAVWGEDFLQQITLNAITYDYRKAIVSTVQYTLLLQIPLFMAVLWALWAVGQERQRVVVFYLAISLPFGFYTMGGTGSDVNLMFDAFLSLAIAVGLALAYVRQRLQPRLGIPEAVVALLPLLAAVSLFTALPEKAFRPRMLADFRSREQAFLEDVAYLRGRPGAALCETLLLCYYADKPFLYDPYNAREMVVKGIRSEAEAVQQFEQEVYAVVQTNHPLPARYFDDPPPPTDRPVVGTHARFTENMRRAIGLHYVQERQTGSRAFYVPRGSQAKPAPNP
ncbi:MAG: hypothetical protein NZ528_00910 [Caldilineales bacterium]|nr:hypothetical protein [Caldilineales bacterium]MDW8316612.1 hypothetical protein [Anaerolineae bacterium]